MAAEKQKRVEHTQQMAMRRLAKRDLSRGWVAWHDMFAEERRRRNLLKKAGAKLTKPKLVAAYLHWRRDWDADEKVPRPTVKARREGPP